MNKNIHELAENFLVDKIFERDVDDDISANISDLDATFLTLSLSLIMMGVN